MITEIKWMLKRRGIKVKKYEELKELYLPEIDRRLREMDVLNPIIEELDEEIKEVVANDERVLPTMKGLSFWTQSLE